VNRLNAWLDSLPREYVWSSGRAVPAFRTCGIVGYHVAVALTLIGAALLDRPLTVALGMSLVCGLSFFAWAMLRRLVTGRETLVLLEHVWVAVACAAAYVAVIGEPVWPWLDVLAVALAAFLAAGRVGCTLAGCCHGYPSPVGIVYRDAHPYRGIRLFPVQAIEAIALGAVCVGGLIELGHLRAGTVALTVAALYALIRFATEGLRGDDRAHTFGVPVGRVMAGLQLAAVVVVEEWLREPSPRPVRYVPVLALLVVCAGAGLLWRRNRPLSPAVVRDVGDAASRPTAVPLAQELGEAVHVAVSGDADVSHVSIAVDADTTGTAARISAAALRIGPDLVSETGVAHTRRASRRAYFTRAAG
jgi:hypothetical protein